MFASWTMELCVCTQFGCSWSRGDLPKFCRRGKLPASSNVNDRFILFSFPPSTAIEAAKRPPLLVNCELPPREHNEAHPISPERRRRVEARPVSLPPCFCPSPSTPAQIPHSPPHSPVRCSANTARDRYMSGTWGAIGSPPQKGIVYYGLSNNRLKPLAGATQAAIFNTFRRTRNQILFWSVPMLVGYELMQWAIER